MNAIPAAKTA